MYLAVSYNCLQQVIKVITVYKIVLVSMTTSCNAHAHIIQSISSLRLQTCYTIRVATNDNFSLSLTTSGCGGGDSSYSCGFKIVVDGFHDGMLIVSSQSCIK